MPDLYLGVDGGATKTHAAVMDAAGRIVGFGIAGTANWERVGLTEAISTLETAIGAALRECGRSPSDVAAATLALAGVDWDQDAATIGAAAGSLGLGCVPAVTNDAIAVLFAGTMDGVGCASVAGTGGKAIAHDGTQTLATIGLGIGEGGGAGQVVDETLAIVARAHHGQRRPSALVGAVLGAAGAPDVSALFYAVGREGFELSESFAPTVFRLADEGDALAVEIVETVARQHAADVVGLADRLEFPGAEVTVVCAGGLHRARSGVFSVAFDSGLAASRRRLVPNVLETVPVVGALCHALIHDAGSISSDQRAAMIESARPYPLTGPTV